MKENKEETKLQSEQKMTLAEAKDKIAERYGFKNWTLIDYYQLGETLDIDGEDIWDEAAELYASQFKSPIHGQAALTITNQKQRIKALEKENAQLQSRDQTEQRFTIEDMKAAFKQGYQPEWLRPRNFDEWLVTRK